MTRMSHWKQVLYTYPCPTCQAAPGSPCHTNNGNRKNEPHADRGRQGTRCWKCGTKLPTHTEPGDLCGKCQLVQDLLIERYTRRPP